MFSSEKKEGFKIELLFDKDDIESIKKMKQYNIILNNCSQIEVQEDSIIEFLSDVHDTLLDIEFDSIEKIKIEYNNKIEDQFEIDITN